MKLLQKLRSSAATKIVAASALTAPMLAFADGSGTTNLWDGAVTALTACGAGIAAVGTVAITLCVAAVSISIIRKAVQKAA